MRKAPPLLLLAAALFAVPASAQLTGTKMIGADYPSVAAAITALNGAGVGAGGVTFNVPSGWTETAPAGGFTITASGTAANPIVFQKAGGGANPTFTASAAQAAGSLTDAVFKLVGADYVTLDRFTLQENAANLNSTPASNNMTEWGVALLCASPTNGAQNNTIRNCTISLNRNYLNTFGIYGNARHSATDPVTVAEATSAAGANSGNRVHANAISNVNFGIVFIGAGTTIAAIDTGNDVGGSSAATGNTLTNWGGGSAPSAYVSLSAANFGICLNQQINDNVSYNTLTSATLAAAVETGGILKEFSVASPTSGSITSNLNNNTVTVTSNPTAATTAPVSGILSRGLTPQLATATINLNGNTLQSCVLGGSTSTTNNLAGILNSSAPGTLNMIGNSVIGLTYAASSLTTGEVAGLRNTGAAGTLNMNNNVLRGLSTVGTAFGAFTYGVFNSGTVTNAINLNGNQFGNASGGFFSTSVATLALLSALQNSGGAQTCAVFIQSNDFRGITHSPTATATIYLCRNTADTFSQVISGNTFTNLSLNTSGSVTLIDNNTRVPVSGGSKTVNNNSIVTAFQKSASGGSVIGYFDNSSSVAGVTVTNSNNNFSNLTVVGSTTVIGWQNTDGGTTAPTKTISGNTMANWSGGTGALTGMVVGFGQGTVTGNVVRNLASAGSLTGLAGSTGGTTTFAQNRTYALSSSGSATVVGFFTPVSGGSSTNFVGNLAYDLSGTHAGTVVQGFSLNSNCTVTNNLIGDLRAPAADSPNDAIVGLRILAGSVNLYFNTVHLTGTSSGTNFHSSALSSSTSGTLLLRNNILSNQITPNGTGRAVALRRSAASLTNYSTSSNQNDFHAGPPGSAHLIYFDGTNSDQTLASFQLRVASRESLSITEQPSFLSLVGSNANFLHIDPTVPTQLEGGGGAIAGVTDDYDGDARQSIPDIGADEFNGLSNDTTPPLIVYTPLGNTLAGLNQTLNTTITDPRGVPTSGAGLPRLYYSINGGAYTPVTAVSGGGGAYSFTFGAAASTAGDVVRYYVVAQDGLPVPNVGAQPAAGAGGFSSSPPSAATPPTTPSQYTTLGAIGGSRTVGVGGDFATLADAALALNSSVLTGPVTLFLTDESYPVSPTPIVFNAISGTSVSNTITIRPATGVTSIITGAASSDCVITLNATDWVIIEGSNVVGGVTRDLTVLSTNAGTAAVICLKSAGTDGATNNIVRNLNLAGTGPTGTYAGIHSGGATVGSPGNGNHSNRYSTSDIRRVRIGFSSLGASAVSKNTGTIFNANLLAAPAPDNIGRMGVYVGYEDGIIINNNLIENIVQTTGNEDSIGIGLGVSQLSTSGAVSTLEVTNPTVGRNRIGTISHSSSYSAFGVVVGAAASGLSRVHNNAIYRIQSNGTAGDFSAGIYALGGTGSSTVVYYNSISLTGYLLPASNGARYPSFALALGGNNPTVTVRNNIFLNTSSNDSDLSFAIGTNSSTFSNLLSSENDFFVGTGAGFFVGRTGSLTNSGSNHTTLANWQAATGQDATSLAVDPLYQGAAILTPRAGSPILAAGLPIAGFPVDLNGVSRNATAPSLGAFEVAAGFPAISFTVLLSTTSLDNRTLNFTVTDTAGVPTSGIGLPVLYYRKGSTGTHVAATSSWSGGSSYSAVIDYTPLGGVSVGDVIEYYVVAQSNTGNVSAVPAGFSNVSANPPACGTPPYPPVAYAISGALSGTYNVGPGQNLTSLTNLGGLFDLLNFGFLAGDVTVNITGNLTEETGFRALLQMVEAGAGGYNLRLKPSGAARTVTGSAPYLIALAGADRVTFDGSLNGGTDRSLTIVNRASNGDTMVLVSADASNGANGNTIQNCIISAGHAATAILASSAVLGNPALSPNSNNTLRNNSILRARNGIFINGPTASFDQNWLITGNSIGSASASDKIAVFGIAVQNSQTLTVTGNTVSGIAAAVDEPSPASGLVLAAGINGALLGGNVIKDIRMANPANGANGIRLSIDSTSANVTIANNFISDIVAPGVNDIGLRDNAYGIVADSGGGFRIYHNTVHLYTGQTEDFSNPACLNLVGPRPGSVGVNTPGSVDVRNNILVNVAPIGFNYAVINSSGAGAAVFSSIDYNNYYSLLVGFQGSAFLTLADWRGATGQDTHSLAVDPLFLNGVDYHLQASSPLGNAGTPLPAVPTDFDGNPRSLLRPEIGADELAPSADAAGLLVSAGSLSPAFAPGTLAYANTVANAVAGLNVTPTALDSNATIEVRVNGGAFAPVTSGLPSANLPLNLGNNPIEVRLTGEFGTPQRTYVVTTLRQAVLSAGALNLTVNQGYARTITQAEILAAATFHRASRQI